MEGEKEQEEGPGKERWRRIKGKKERERKILYFQVSRLDKGIN